MPRASKIVHCVDCREEFPRKQLNRSGRCLECASRAIRDNMRQLRAHRGPWYEKWKSALKHAAGRL